MRRSLVVVTVLAASFLVVVPAEAESDVVDRITQLQATAHVTLTETGQTEVSDLVGAEIVVDTVGNIVDRLPFRAQAASGAIRPMSLGNPSCVYDTEREGFTAYLPPTEYPIDKRNEKGSFKYHLYSVDRARHDQRGDPTVQFLGCGVGGVDGQNGSRIRVSGPGMAFNDAEGSNILGTKWREGETPEDYTITLGFEVPVRGVNISGSIQQHPSNYLRGSVVPPYGHDQMERLHRNAFNAWWEDGCRPRCTRFGGSNHYQGSVGEGLWEFPQWYKGDALARGWTVAAYVEHHCGNPFGC